MAPVGVPSADMTTSKVSACVAALLLSGSAGCCFGNHLPPPPPTTSASTEGQATLTLAPGFAPDPTLVTGTAGGPTDAATMGPACRGWIASVPSVVLTTSAAIPILRVVVNASQDTTLVVRLASGEVLCDDDSGGSLNPAISGSFPAGRHEIYVGEYTRSSAGTPFQLGLTTNAALGPADLGAPGTMGGNAIPTSCGMQVPTFGPLQLGTIVTLGVHSPYTGPDGRGHIVGPADQHALDWSPDMQPFVGQQTAITALAGVDDAGCPVARVAADGGRFIWRIRDMHL